MITTHKLQQILPVLIITFSTCLSIGYSLGPLFEGPDERQHYYYIRYRADTGQLANVRFLQDPDLGVEMFQPPLYYSLAALIKRSIRDSDFYEIVALKNIYRPEMSRLFSSDPLVRPDNDNKNYLLHSRREDFPYTNSPTALAVHLIRLVSVLMSTLTLVACWHLFKLVWPDNPQRQWIALGVASFWPLRTYMGGVINNDNAATVTSVVSLLLIVRQYVRGPSALQATLLGVMLGAAALSKETGLLLAVPLGAMWLLDFKRQWKLIPVTVLAAAIIAGWWYFRNWMLYHVITSFSLQPMYLGSGSGTNYIPLKLLPDRLLIIAQHFWGNVGHDGSIPLSPELSAISSVFLGLGLAGAVWKAIRWIRASYRRPGTRRAWVLIAIFGSYLLALIAGLSYIVLVNLFAVQPRFLIPGAAVIASIFALGWETLIPIPFRQRAGLSLTALWAVMGSLAIVTCFIPAYRPLVMPPQIEYRRNIFFKDYMYLLGVSRDVIHVQPGEQFKIRLYWAAVLSTQREQLGVLVTPLGSPIHGSVTFPGNGHILSTEWQPGQQWAEDHTLDVPANTKPGKYYLLVYVTHGQPIQFLPAYFQSDVHVPLAPVAVIMVDAAPEP